MASITYAAGWAADMFSGWNGVGPAVYDAVNTTTSYISTQVYTKNAYGLGYTCLWMNFGQSLTSFYTRFSGSFGQGASLSLAATASIAVAMWHTTDNTRFLSLRAKPNAAWLNRMYLSTSISDTSTWVDLGFDVTLATTGTPVDVQVSGCGTTQGTISVWVSNKLAGTWTGDLTNFTSFDAVSFHNIYLPNNAYWAGFEYVYVTNFPTMYTTITKQWLSTIGSENSWVGNTTSFSTYPVDYTTFNGEYALAAGNQITFVPADISLGVGYETKSVIVNAPMRAGSDNANVTVAAIAKNVTTSTIAPSPASTISQSNSSYTYVLSADPITGKPWTLSGVNNYEFGFKRTN